jgi:hypothetical protein
MLLVAIFWALLAGLGFDAWRSDSGRRRRWANALASLCMGCALLGAFLCGPSGAPWVAGLFEGSPTQTTVSAALSATGGRLGVALLCAAPLLVLLWRPRLLRARTWLRVAIASCVVLDLLIANRSINPTAPPALFKTRPPALDAIRTTTARRVYVYDYFISAKAVQHLGHGGYSYRLPPGAEPWRFAESLRQGLYWSLLGTWGVESSFDLDYLGLEPRAQAWLTR